MTQEEILEVKLLTVFEVVCYLGLSCMEEAPAGELLCGRNALPGEVVAGLDQVASSFALAGNGIEEGLQTLRHGLKPLVLKTLVQS